jgi:transaldolase
MPPSLLKTRIFADGADRSGILEIYKNPLIKGFTTNPTLMRASGIVDFEAFARDILSQIPDRPFSLEVFSDDFEEMARQAKKIASWGPNVYVKIPITNTKGISSAGLIQSLAKDGLKLNVTALMTLTQVRESALALACGLSSFISVFAGRIADTGRDPVPIMQSAVSFLSDFPKSELIWASPREIFNLFQADQIGCPIITLAHPLLEKLGLYGKDLEDFSLETVKMFYQDALKSGFNV